VPLILSRTVFCPTKNKLQRQIRVIYFCIQSLHVTKQFSLVIQTIVLLKTIVVDFQNLLLKNSFVPVFHLLGESNSFNVACKTTPQDIKTWFDKVLIMEMAVLFFCFNLLNVLVLCFYHCFSFYLIQRLNSSS